MAMERPLDGLSNSICYLSNPYSIPHCNSLEHYTVPEPDGSPAAWFVSKMLRADSYPLLSGRNVCDVIIKQLTRIKFSK